uniref:restriction endonuclease subunit S n=1 Tax=uncultured Haemophilus sp. TaxID=237779 RepID=UPI0025FD6F68
KGEVYPFIDIDKVSPTKRSVTNAETKTYDGQSSSKFCNGDTVFSRITPCLENRKIAKVSIDGEAAFGSTEFYIFRAKKEKADERFTYYLTSSDAVVLPAINSMTGASGRQRADKRFIQRLKLNLPDLPTQEKIADVLSAYDDLIEANNHRIELLEQTAQELYKEWFVRLRFPGYENVKFTNGLPEGWSYVRFGKAIEIIDGDRGINYPKQEEFYPEGDCLFLNAGNVTTKGFDFSACSYITKEKDAILRKGKLQHGDVVLTTRGTVGNVAYLNKTMTFSEMRINSGMVILRNLGVVSPEYIYTALRHEYMQKLMTLYASGSAQPQLPIKDMKRMKVIKGDAKTMEQFTEISADIYNQISLLIMKNQTIAKQRDMLLPRLMSGKLEV